MTTTPESTAEFADPNKCICCERSKTGGSFFEVNPFQIRDGKGVITHFRFVYEGWDANIDLFQEASRQGCQRCAVAFDMVTTWLEDIPRSDRRHITVRDGGNLGFMVADVRVYLYESWEAYLQLETTVVLELLSANRRYPK
jgi:hypothetical protein